MLSRSLRSGQALLNAILRVGFISVYLITNYTEGTEILDTDERRLAQIINALVIML